MSLFQGVQRTLKNSIKGFIYDDCMTMAAALAFYAIFSLPPLLLIMIMFAGNLWGAEAIQGQIEYELERLIGSLGKDQLLQMMDDFSHRRLGPLGVTGSYVFLIIGAIGVVMQLQSALNRIWHDPIIHSNMTIIYYLLKRSLSIVLILTASILMLVTLVLSTTLTIIANVAEKYDPFAPGTLENFGQTTITLILMTVIIAAMFRWLPDDPARRKDVWRGAFVTAILLTIGKEFLASYLSSLTAISGSRTGALFFLILWIYYSSMILLFGAELTKAWGVERLNRKSMRATVPLPKLIQNKTSPKSDVTVKHK